MDKEVDWDAIGNMLEVDVRYAVKEVGYNTEVVLRDLPKVWPHIQDYHRRAILVDIEVGITLNPTALKDQWEALLEQLTPPKYPFTIDYVCGKCKRGDIKLWRGVHGCTDEDGNKLLCAKCLAPDTQVGHDGKYEDSKYGERHDQVAGWLPAVPVDGSYWGYTSVPRGDVKWWKALPTYR